MTLPLAKKNFCAILFHNPSMHDGVIARTQQNVPLFDLLPNVVTLTFAKPGFCI